MKIAIEGMHCQGCVNRVKKALENVEGVSISDVQIGWAELEADASREAAVLHAIRKAGFEVRTAQ